MKVSCTHFQCSAGAFTYLRDHYNHSYSSDMNSQTLSINICLMLVNAASVISSFFCVFKRCFHHPRLSPKAQAQECLLEKTLLDNRKSHLIAKICAQVGCLSFIKIPAGVWFRTATLMPSLIAGVRLLQGLSEGFGSFWMCARKDSEGVEETHQPENQLLHCYYTREFCLFTIKQNAICLICISTNMLSYTTWCA